MARVLYDGLVEYEDGTPATTSQMAKDVVEFLNWAAEPEMDQRKKMGVAVITITSVLLALSIWVKRYRLLSHDGFRLTLLMYVLGTSGRQSRQERSSTILQSAGILTHVANRPDLLSSFLFVADEGCEDCNIGRVHSHWFPTASTSRLPSFRLCLVR